LDYRLSPCREARFPQSGTWVILQKSSHAGAALMMMTQLATLFTTGYLSTRCAPQRITALREHESISLALSWMSHSEKRMREVASARITRHWRPSPSRVVGWEAKSVQFENEYLCLHTLCPVSCISAARLNNREDTFSCDTAAILLINGKQNFSQCVYTHECALTPLLRRNVNIS
jgi:hypothetical protein